MKRFSLLLTLSLMATPLINAASAKEELKVSRLRCEYREKPQGINIVKPRLNWLINSKEKGQGQSAYQVLVAESREILDQNKGSLWDSGKVESDDTIHIVYGGNPLKAGMNCFWKVRVWPALSQIAGDIKGKPSAWSETATWSMGLLEPNDWKAQWIADSEDQHSNEAGAMPATMLRKTFSITTPVKRAMVYVTGLGVYELYINGKRIGDHLLAPEFTVYNKRIQYQCYDVTGLLSSGENAAGAILGDGWNGEYFFGMCTRQKQRPFEGRRGFIMQLQVEQTDGTTRTIVTDSTWQSTRNGPIRSSSLYNGEEYDARMEMPGWDTAKFIPNGWTQAVLCKYLSEANCVWQSNTPIRIVKELNPISLTEPNPGVYIYDFGQNMVGWCRVKVNGRAGTQVKLRYAEMLNDDGSIYTDNLRAAKQTDVYTKRTDKAEYFEPHFTYHGFRYVEVTGREYKPAIYMPAYKPGIKDLMGQVIHSDEPSTGEFVTSSEHINKIMHMIEWVQRGNMHSVPTDCPQRDERAGWMGDIQSFAQTAMFNMEIAGFLSKWIMDVRDSQTEDGRYPNFAPMDLNRWAGGTPAWADAGVIVPWRMYQNYADKRLLTEHYESACRWVDYVHNKNPDLLWSKDLGSNFNDWLNGDTLEAEGWPKTGAAVPPRVLSTAFFAHSTELVSKMARVLGKDEDAEKYAERAEGIKLAFNKRYVKSDGKIEGDTQAGYALALRFNLLPQEMRSKAAKHMVDQFKRYNGHMSTGIQTTHRLMLELTRNGYNNEAYRLLNLKTIPSWGFMAEQGATTVWERWDGYIQGRGFQKPLMNSFNHWALGAVGEWMWRNIAGLNPDDTAPGWKHFNIAPRPGGGLTYARGRYDSIRGTIISEWRIKGGEFILDVTVPPNTTATVKLPSTDINSITVNNLLVSSSKWVKPLKNAQNRAHFQVHSGQYKFVSSYNLEKRAKTNTTAQKPATDGLIGSNYTPAYAVNQVQFWHDFRSDVIAKELAAAKQHFGISSLRVFLHNINFDQDRKNFMGNIDRFITLCDQNGIKPGFVFFDGCHRDEGIFLDRPTEPVYGFHNGCWAQCPQARDIDKENLNKFKPYIQEIIKPYRADKRILFWEIHNEPPAGDEYRAQLKQAGYQWAKKLKPIQPVINCEYKGGWGDCEFSDIVDAHIYNNAWGLWTGLMDTNPDKGTVFTEAGARWKATRRIHGSPTDIIDWLTKRRKADLSTPGVYLCWELMAGNSNCRWHWVDNGHEDDKPDPEPEIPWCGLLWPDTTPVSLAESEACKLYATGKSDALFYDCFESGSSQWKLCGTKHMKSNHGLYVGNRQKAIAGDPQWRNYILEGRVLPKIHWLKGKQPDYSKEEGKFEAGLLFRVNNPGDSFNDLRAYSIFHDSKTLTLGKFDRKQWKELDSFDLTTLKTESRLNEWSMIRVEAIGPSIRIWFNRTHGDPKRGLRIEHTDTDNPILSGSIGVASIKTTALFDDIVVLPAQ